MALVEGLPVLPTAGRLFMFGLGLFVMIQWFSWWGQGGDSRDPKRANRRRNVALWLGGPAVLLWTVWLIAAD